MAEGVGFEPTRRSSRLSDFESGAFSLSAIPPQTAALPRGPIGSCVLPVEAVAQEWWAIQDSNL